MRWGTEEEVLQRVLRPPPLSGKDGPDGWEDRGFEEEYGLKRLKVKMEASGNQVDPALEVRSKQKNRSSSVFFFFFLFFASMERKGMDM